MKLVKACWCLAMACIVLSGCNVKSEEGLGVIMPPLSAISLPSEIQKINPDHAQRVLFENEFSVTVPKYAFVDKSGNPVRGEVAISLQIYDSPASILASGIPMHYQDENVQATFQSAGMFDIRAMAGGGEVQLAEGKELAIIYPTEIAGDYDFFQFVTTDKPGEGKWVREELSVTPPDVELPKDEQSFKLQWNEEEFPTLKAFDTVYWNLATPYRSPDTEQNKWVLDTKWDAFRISRPSHGLKDPDHFSGKHVNLGAGFIGFLYGSTENVDYSFPESHEVDSLGTTMFLEGNSVKFYDKIGNVIGRFTPDNERHRIKYSRVINGTVSVGTSRGDYVVKNHGKESYFFEGENIQNISPDGSLVLTTLRGDFDDYYLNNLAGEPLEIFKILPLGINFFVRQVIFTESYVVNRTTDGFQVYDMKGERLYTVQRSLLNLKHLTGNELTIIEDRSLSVFNLDNKNELKQPFDPMHLYDSISGKELSDTDYSPPLTIIEGVIPEYSSIYFSNLWGIRDEQYMVWNYKEDKLTELDFRGSVLPYDNPRFVVGVSYLDSTAVLFDLKVEREIYRASIKDLGRAGAMVWQENMLWFDEAQDRIFLNVGGSSKLLNMKGEVVVDFNAFSPDLLATGIVEDEIIVTYTDDGTYTAWNLEGEVLSTTDISPDFESNVSFYDQNLLAFSSVPRVMWVFDKWGKLKVDAASGFLSPVANSGLSVLSHTSTDDLVELFELPDGALQLTLTKDSLEFVTYVTLTEGTGDLLPAYEAAYLEWTNQKRKKIEKAALERRRLSINSMGLYNCDILLRVPDALVFAASFEVEGKSITEGTRLYHMLDKRGNAISEVAIDKTKEFPIDPNDSHRFIAILPDGRIGLLDFSDTAGIDWSEVKEKGEYTFNLKIQERDFDSLSDLNWLFSSQ